MELLKLIGILLLINIFVYLIGSFIAFDINPLHWWMFNSSVGRVVFLIIESSLFVSAIKIND